MKQGLLFFGVLVLLAAAAGAGYWYGAARQAPVPPAAVTESRAQSPAPAAQRKILYYRNPMGLPDTSPVPKKDSMGMDYIAVYEGEEPTGPELKISLDRVQKLGVRTEPATLRDFSRVVRAVGTVQVNERLEHTLAPRFEGWIQRLLVATTGEVVRRGQPLMEVYSPELVTAQQEYVIARRGIEELREASPDIQATMKSLAESSLQRLRNWDISDEELARLRAEGSPRNVITLRSPVDGVVLAKPSVQGMRFMPGEPLYRIVDLSSLWLLAEVFEQDLGWIALGQSADIRVNAYPDKVFRGKVAFIYPTVTPETRTARVRIELANPGRLLKPDMYANVELAVRLRGGRRVTVSDSSVIDSGTRQLVLVQRGEGLFEPREVKLGHRGEGFVEVLSGLKGGEQVVVSANFLIDAESNLKAALGGFGSSAPGGQAKPAAGAAHAARGTVESVDAKTGAVTIAHEPVASLKWPAMTIEFKVKEPALLLGVTPGTKLSFEFREQAQGEWVIVRLMAPKTGGDTRQVLPAGADSHKGH